MIAAILRAQFLSMRVGGGSIIGIVAGVVWYGLWVVLAMVAVILTANADPTQLGHTLALALAGVCAYWQLIPMVSASLGASLDMRKLLAYPVPHQQLFLVEVLLRLTTGIEMLLLLAGGLVGLCLNSGAGGLRGLPRFAASFLLLALFNLLLASGLRSILERLLARRRVREILAVLMATVWMVPRFLMSTGYRPKVLDGAGAWIDLVAFPWTAVARAALGQAPALNLLTLLLWTLAALWFGRTQFERSLRFDAVAAHATDAQPRGKRTTSWIEGFYRWPALLWSDPLASIVEKELRSLARTPRFRGVFVMGFTFGLLVWYPVLSGSQPGQGHGATYTLIVVCIYALVLLGQVTYWNCFGFDRAATAFYFAAPQPFSTVLLGKNLAALAYVYLETLVLTAVTLTLGLASGWQNVAETLIVIGVCGLYMMTFGNLTSVRYPRAANPERVSQGGGGGRMHGLIFLLFPLTLIPVGMAYVARYAFDSNVAFAIVLSLAAALGVAIYKMSMVSAANTAVHRREEFVGELSKGDGPVVAG